MRKHRDLHLRTHPFPNRRSSDLQDPAVQQDISRTFDNIGTAFQNLTPLIPALTQAFADLAAEGSQFLPGLATGLSDAARDFAATIRNMSEGRSEEHTSELQSLMRISSAVFCLKKKTKHST